MLMQPYLMPDPIVADPSKIPATKLPETYLYDIPTTVGQEIELIDLGGTTAIQEVLSAEQQRPTTDVAYALDGPSPRKVLPAVSYRRHRAK